MAVSDLVGKRKKHLKFADRFYLSGMSFVPIFGLFKKSLIIGKLTNVLGMIK